MFAYKMINAVVAFIWFVNGFFCKLLNFVPRHQQIVDKIIGGNHAGFLTKSIGIAEIAMAAWILSGKYRRFNVVSQVAIIACMNIMEFLLVPELLLWGRANAVFAALLIVVILVNEFYVHPKPIA
ncbi:MAG: hypothetical protein EOO13_10515 [Chitinophagaceae bacterium]|nr:MAG: hypothetical protein EOO13_10515 [Chitinophagaceae bacterium]